MTNSVVFICIIDELWINDTVEQQLEIYKNISSCFFFQVRILFCELCVLADIEHLSDTRVFNK